MKKDIIETYYNNREKFYFKKRIMDLGVSRNYLGFYFLTDVCEMIINNNLKVRSFSREIYPIVAKNYDVNEDTIERNIRNVIDAFWEKSIKDKLMPFWGKDEKPSCRKFIDLVCQFMLVDLI